MQACFSFGPRDAGPLGGVFRCPLPGYIADRIGRRKPVLIGGAVLMLAASAAVTYPALFPLRSRSAAGDWSGRRDDPSLDHQGGQSG
jgi:MFS family permease